MIRALILPFLAALMAMIHDGADGQAAWDIYSGFEG